jgi:hypothetical protein
MLRTVLRITIISLAGLLAPWGQADEIDPLFQSSSTLEVEIDGPFEMLSEDRPDEEEFPGKFRYTADDGEIVEFEVVLRTRGRVRRLRETCTFPPIRLNFKKKEVDETLFHKQDKVKLVTHCRNRAKRYEQAVVAEYLTYKMFSLLTDRSFQARLLNATYIYTDEDRSINSFAVLIEPQDRLEKRLGAKRTEADWVKVSDIEPGDLNLASVFHYFIGNTDFSPIGSDPEEDCCHNQALLEREGALALTIPYDFDQSGLVGAPHAAPNPRFKLRSPRQRLYRGRCENNDYLPATFDLFRERRAAIEQLVREQPEYDDGMKKSMLKYIADFYETIDNPKEIQREFVSRCI